MADLTASPIAMVLENDSQSNSNLKLISLFANYSTSKDVYHKLHEDRAELEESGTLDRYFRSGLEGNRQYMANLVKKQVFITR